MDIYKLMIWLCIGIYLNTADVKGDSKHSRIILEMKEQNFDDRTISLDVNIPESMEPNLDSNQTILYSMTNNIYLWNISQERESSSVLIKTDGLTSFHQISSRKFLVREGNLLKVYQLSNDMISITQVVTLVCTEPKCCLNSTVICIQSGPGTLGPIAVDSSPNSQVVFFIISSSIYSVDLSSNALPTNSAFNGVSGSATAIAFNGNFSTAYIFFRKGSVITMNSFNLHTQKSNPVQLHRFSNPVKQAISIKKGVLLCRTSEDELLLVDANTGHHSGVLNETTQLPCKPNCSSSDMKVKNMVDIKNQGYLLAVDPKLRLIKLKYNVAVIDNDANNISDITVTTFPNDPVTSTTTSDEGIDEVPTIVGCSVAAVVLVLGILSAVLWVLYTKKRRQLIQKFPPHRRQRVRSVTNHVIEDFAMNTLARRDQQRATPQRRERDRELDVRPSHTDNLPQAPSPQKRYRQPLEHTASNSAFVPDDPNYEEVLGNVGRPIRVQASVPRPSFVPPKLSALPLNSQDVNTAPPSSELFYNISSIEEPAYCDNDQVPHDCDAEYAEYSYAVEPRFLSNSSDKPSAFASAKRSLSHNRESDRELEVRPSHHENLSQVRSPPLPIQYRSPLKHMRSSNGDVPDGPYYEEVLEKGKRPIRVQASVQRPPYVPPRESDLPPIPNAANTTQHRSELSNSSPSIEQSSYCDNDQVPHDHEGLYVDYAYAVEPKSLSKSSDVPSAFTSARRSLSHNRELDVRPSHSDNLSQPPPLQTQHRPPLEHTSSNDAYVPNEPYYEEVLENVERKIYVQASVPQPLHVKPRTSSLHPIPSAVSTAPHSSDLSNNSPRTAESPYCDNRPAPLDRDAEYADHSYAVVPRTLSNSSDESSAFTSAWRSLSHTLSGVLQIISAEFEKPSDSEIAF